MRRAVALRAALVALAFLLVLAGCGSNVSRANFDKISEGMKEDQVKAILGSASESRSSSVKVEDAVFTSTQTKWRNDKGTIVVVFLNGEVQQKVFYEPGAEPPPVPRS
jgi:hypothetical protein